MSLIKVRYKGVADVRTITRKQFASVGVTVDKDVEWNRSNSFTVVLDTNERMEEVLREQGHFTLSTLDSGTGETPISTATNPAGEGDLLVDGNTGDTTVNRVKTPKP